MPESKIETCEIELAKNNNNIAKFLEEHKVYNVKTKREIFNNFQKLKDSYLLSKNFIYFYFRKVYIDQHLQTLSFSTVYVGFYNS